MKNPPETQQKPTLSLYRNLKRHYDEIITNKDNEIQMLRNELMGNKDRNNGRIEKN